MLKKITVTVALGLIAFGTISANAAGTTQRPYSVTDEMTRAECGDCHMAFPASRLTGTAWVKIMSNLSDHFGDDATLDAESVKHIQDYLVKNALDRPGKNGKMGIRTKMRLAAWKKKGFVDPIRITETPEWTRHHTKKHNYHDMAKEVGYTGGANCIKCHKGAERGLYEDFGH